MSEKWREYYTEEQLKSLQNIEKKALKSFIEVCEKNGLEYFVYGGTLLGVEKYNGLIPWDDDIDVALPRKSYARLMELGSEAFSSDLFLQTPYNCKKSPFPYAKLRVKGTKYVEYVNRNIDIESGIYIDIYPVDKIPDDEKLRRKQYKQVRKWILIYVCRQSKLYDKETHGVKDVLKKIAKWVICNGLKVFSQKYCMNKIDKYMTRYNDAECQRYAALNSPNYNNIYLNLYPLQSGKFDDLNVKLPGDYRTHLRMRYGDYSDLPPEDKRVGHIPYILDCGDKNESKS